MSFLDDLRRERQKLAQILTDPEYAGIREIVEDLYPDRAHFIYEVLQNAEDVGATEACFSLNRTSLIFAHNGEPFSEKNVRAITNIGRGTKKDEDDKIGRFGIGFKAVFAYTETPHIWSTTFSFKISDLVVPTEISSRRELGNRTCFEFPFNNVKKPCEVAYAEIEAGLKHLAETTLLFLSHLNSISWQIDGAVGGRVTRVQHSENHVEVRKENASAVTAVSNFLRFHEPVEGLDNRRIAVAFKLDCRPNIAECNRNDPVNKQVTIVPATPGRVAVFFPAEKETSNLRFHLHAPFVPELSRASVKETPANQPLFAQLGKLAASSLHRIRELGLLAPEFLAVLPNPLDQIPDRYECIRLSIVEEMTTQPLTPTYAKGHAPARDLLQSRAAVKELLSDGDIEFLVDYENEPPKWAVNAAQKNSNADRFLASLQITEWDISQLVELLFNKTADGTEGPPNNINRDELKQWLAGKSLDWHQELYALLYLHYSQTAEWQKPQQASQLRRLQIVRKADGSYGIGGSCFFPGEDTKLDDVFPRVELLTYTSGRSRTQQDNAKDFLKLVGVREVGTAEFLEGFLNLLYRRENLRPDKAHMAWFVSLVKDDPELASLFSPYYIFQLTDGNYGRPSQTFVDRPFAETGLGAYYDALGERVDRYALSPSYSECSIEPTDLLGFAKAVGVRMALDVCAARCQMNPAWELLRTGEVQKTSGDTSRRHNSDYEIPEFAFLVNRQSEQASRLVWITMANVVKPEHLIARYQRNNKSPERSAPSQLVHHLLSSRWIPQGNNHFVCPADAVPELLPAGFPFDPGWPWIRVIRFGSNEPKHNAEERHRQIIARELGFSDGSSLERAKRFSTLPTEEQDRILAEWEHRAASELPEHESANPTRRADLVRKGAAEAAERRTEERTRSVSVGIEEVKARTEPYLRQQYTTGDEMICQICKTTLPFKLDDGSHYFEKVEFVKLRRRHHENYLALCPNHAAMFMYANGTDSEMIDLLMGLAGNELSVVLAQKDVTIYFTKMHIADLRTIIAAEEAEVEPVYDVGEDGSDAEVS